MKWTSRKVQIAMFWQAVFTAVFVATDKLSEANFIWLTSICVGGYLTANVVAKFSGKPKEQQ